MSDTVRSIGAQMATMMYNLSQGANLPAGTRDLMRDMHQRWDAAVSADRPPPPQSLLVGWQDISTAPKTGEEFIARTGPEWSSFSCSWDGEMFVHYDRDDGIIAYGPKQWMPMPGPDAAPESPSDLSVGGAERLQDLEHLLESVRACYFVGRPDCPNEFVQSTWEKVKAADDARAALAPAEHVVVTDTMVENALMHEHGIAWDKGSTEDDARAMRNSMRELIDTALTAPPRDHLAVGDIDWFETCLNVIHEHKRVYVVERDELKRRGKANAHFYASLVNVCDSISQGMHDARAAADVTNHGCKSDLHPEYVTEPDGTKSGYKSDLHPGSVPAGDAE